MSCEQIRAELDAYLDGELEAPEAAEVARHLAECPACSRFLAERRAVALAVRNLPRVGAPAGFLGKFRAERERQGLACASSTAPVRSAWRAPWVLGGAVAAAAALLLSVSFLRADRQRQPASAAASLEERARDRDAAAERLDTRQPPAPPQAAKLDSGSATAFATPAKTLTKVAPAPAPSADLGGQLGAPRTAEPARQKPAAEEPPKKAPHKLAEPQAAPAEAPAPMAALVPPGAPAAKPMPAPPKPAAPLVAPAKPPAPGGLKEEKDSAPIRREGLAEPEAGKPDMSPGRAKIAEEAGKVLDREEAALPKAGDGKLKEEPLRSFALRAESPAAAIRRARLIAESLGGREFGTVPEKAQSGATKGQADTAGPGGAGGAPAPAGKANVPGRDEEGGGLAQREWGAEPAPRPAGSKGVAPADKAAEDKTCRIVLVLPADRLDTFKRALAGWSSSAREGQAAGDGQGRVAEKNAAAGELALRCTLAGAEAGELDGKDQAGAYAAGGLFAAAATGVGAAPGQSGPESKVADQTVRGNEADRGVRKKIVVVTLTISAE